MEVVDVHSATNMKRFHVRKIVYAENLEEALKIEKRIAPVEVTLDEEVTNHDKKEVMGYDTRRK